MNRPEVSVGLTPENLDWRGWMLALGKSVREDDAIRGQGA